MQTNAPNLLFGSRAEEQPFLCYNLITVAQKLAHAKYTLVMCAAVAVLKGKVQSNTCQVPRCRGLGL